MGLKIAWRMPRRASYVKIVRLCFGGSWAAIRGVISPLIWVITIVILLITLHTTTPEPPSGRLPWGKWFGCSGCSSNGSRSV